MAPDPHNTLSSLYTRDTSAPTVEHLWHLAPDPHNTLSSLYTRDTSAPTVEALIYVITLFQDIIEKACEPKNHSL